MQEVFGYDLIADIQQLKSTINNFNGDNNDDKIKKFVLSKQLQRLEQTSSLIADIINNKINANEEIASLNIQKKQALTNNDYKLYLSLSAKLELLLCANTIVLNQSIGENERPFTR